ncbi:cytochrome b/b6 domain-containing protein [Rhodovulum adriaticum]|uniref:Cytochrome b n=1 Tax=Rhodovulum adriaticum TaxID=35804 RepID=A0A4R2NNC7_RHOAD|nr:cytochrome b/b6 domain-containing protein [Rhodovulum adriaticum]MBK1634579.1 cytochrome B [Rhodovulum adriaticum]TCP23052.1 cytochrome b [Rhodovulum adriaticum]
MPAAPQQKEPLVPVWDIWVRLFHWTLAASIAGAAATGFLGDARWLAVHLTCGLSAAALVLARIVWGVLGSTHARFADFLPHPRAVIAHMFGNGPRHLGHNPLGALMVLAIIGAITALTVTGLIGLGGWLRNGPFAADLGTAGGRQALELHELLAWAVLAMVALHLPGVFHERHRRSDPLIRAMLTGRKPARAGDARAHAAQPQGQRALKIIAMLGALLGLATAGLSARTVPDLPAPMPPVVAEECGACHMTFHPSLLPAASWHDMMSGLDDHFGENAALSADLTAEIEDWLTAHAAETVETAPARLFANPNPEAPGSITRTAAWKRLHGDLPDSLFARAPIYARTNCIACHGDAETGLFSPFALSIPKETSR